MGGSNLLLIGFSDLWSVLMFVPIVVAIVVTMFLFMDGPSNTLIIMLPNFEMVWFVLPVIVFVISGLASFGISAVLVGDLANEIIVILMASQWQWEGSIISAMSIYIIRDYLLCGLQGGSCDVLHSYSVLGYGVHTDCIPGKLTEHLVQVNLEGEEYVTCQELCGYRHSGMSIILGL